MRRMMMQRFSGFNGGSGARVLQLVLGQATKAEEDQRLNMESHIGS